MIIFQYFNRFRILTFLALFSIIGPFVSGLDLKKFDPAPEEREKYLAFKPPVALRYKPVPLEADRLNLIRLDLTMTTTSTPTNADSNQTDEPDFPVVTYSTDKDMLKDPVPSMLPQSPPPNSLPLADPFEGVSGMDVGSTDELLNVFDELKIDTRSVRMNAIPFIPPYTVAPDNLKVETKATYRRVSR